MEINKILEQKVKELIRETNMVITLKHIVTVTMKVDLGYNYATNEHEYINAAWNIKEVIRQGKKGTVYVSDGVNIWRPSDLSETDCKKILNEL